MGLSYRATEESPFISGQTQSRVNADAPALLRSSNQMFYFVDFAGGIKPPPTAGLASGGRTHQGRSVSLEYFRERAGNTSHSP